MDDVDGLVDERVVPLTQDFTRAKRSQQAQQSAGVLQDPTARRVETGPYLVGNGVGKASMPTAIS